MWNLGDGSLVLYDGSGSISNAQSTYVAGHSSSVDSCLIHIDARERGGVVVERRTPNLEVLCSNPTSVIGLCP